MHLSKWGWLSVKFLVVLALPTLLYIWLSQTILARHLKTVVINDPDSSLTRSIQAMKIALDEEYLILRDQVNSTTDKDWLQKALSDPTTTPAQFQQTGRDLSTFLQRPLLILVNKNGGVLYDTLNLPKPGLVPAPTPTIAPINSYISPDFTPGTEAASEPLYYSIKNWPGITEVLQRSTQTGLFTYGDQYYLGVCSSISYKKKVVGALLLGVKLNGEVLQRIKAIIKNDVAFFANGKIQISTFPETAASDVNKTTNLARRNSIQVNDQNYLWDDDPINDLSQNLAGHFFIYQPIQQSITLEGNFFKDLAYAGTLFLIFLLILGLWFVTVLLKPLHQFTAQIDQMKEGNWNVEFPTDRLDDWGDLARSLNGLIKSIKDKERVSLVLGKVVDPASAQKLLAQKDYFALKGERRDCTLLKAQIKGFDRTGPNMDPQEMVEVLNEYLGLINRSTFQFEGLLDKFVGETATAVWGAPFAHEDKEIRALKAALDLKERVQQANIQRIKEGRAVYSLGIAIHSGSLVAGNLGSEQRYDYSIIGEPLKILDDLCAVTAPEQILITQETYEKIQDLVQAKPNTPLWIPGHKEPLGVYEIKGFL